MVSLNREAVLSVFSDDELLPISALQHLIFCERQCALIHVERLWAENRWTVEGMHLHAKAHSEKSSTVDGLHTTRSMPLASHMLGLSGVADVIEFPKSGPPVPVEYKRGRPKKNDSDRVQLAAQAMCLEEMLAVTIPVGFLFYGKNRRRVKVELDAALRERTAQTAKRLHEMIANRETPTAMREPKCDQCSLVELCLPSSMRFKTGSSQFVARELAATIASDGPLTDDEDE